MPDLGARLLRFAVVADSHLEPDPGSGGSDRPRSNRRFAAVVDAIRVDPPAFVLHLGDVVHPLPDTPARDAARAAAEALLARLPCPFYVCPGNHDIGDKPQKLMPAASIEPDWLARFEADYGAQWQSFDQGGCRFVLINNLLVNSGLPAEAAQEAWLRRTLAEAPGRVFLAMHYPLYLRDRDEGSLYDNIDEPGRGRLSAIIQEHAVAAVFSGHVHIRLHNRLGATDLLGLPSTAFVRRDFSEMFRIEPFAEYGREDPEKLGYLEVNVHEHGHRCHLRRIGEPARPGRAGEWSGLGVNLRHPWCETVELPFNPPTDAFARKRVRNDYPSLALAELGLRDLRVPIADLLDPEIRERVRLLVDGRFRFTAFTPGLPDAALRAALRPALDCLDTLEIIVTGDEMSAAIETLAPWLEGTATRLQITPLLPPAATTNAPAGSHVIAMGFPPRAEAMGAALCSYRRDGLQLVAGAALPIAALDAPLLRSLEALGQADGIATALLLDWRADDKDGVGADPTALAGEIARVLAVLAEARATEAETSVRLFLDTLMAFDRSYHARTGLIDRRANLTEAGRALLRAMAC